MMRIVANIKRASLLCKSDTDFTVWKDKLIREGVMGIQERDSMVNDYADSWEEKAQASRPPWPPISYMKERAGYFSPYPP